MAQGPLAIALMSMGWLLVVSSMWKLGITGTYLGDHFGILLSKRITSFPFNVCEHPMYEGATMVFLGYALWQSSIAGLALGMTAGIVYTVAGYFEGHFTSMIYSSKQRRFNNKDVKVK